MQDCVRYWRDWCAGIYCKNAGPGDGFGTGILGSRSPIRAPAADRMHTGKQKENRPQNIYGCPGRFSCMLYDGEYYRACTFASRASCNTWEKFRFISRAAVLSHAGMVSVFLTDLSKCSFA